MPPVQFELTLEFTLNGRRYRTEPTKVTARLIAEPEREGSSCDPAPPGPSADSPAQVIRHSSDSRHSSPLASPARTTGHSLRKGLGFWTITFNGQDAIVKHERGIFYVAWLLTHPPQHPIHALDLMAKIPEIY